MNKGRPTGLSRMNDNGGSSTLSASQAVAAGPGGDTPVTVIRPLKGWIAIDFAELWRYRELFGFLVWRDVLVKYKQTLLGFAWAILVPFFQMIVFTIIFGNFGKVPTNGLPGPVYYFAGLLPWTYFATSLSTAGNSLVGSAGMLTKIYFPRLIVPAGPCISSLVDFAIAFGFFIGVMLFFHILPAATILLIPVFLALAFATALGIGLFFSALMVKYRDVRYVIQFLIQLWMYCTVIIPFSQINLRFEHYGAWRYLYGLNPMAGVVEGFRWSLAHHEMTVSRPGSPSLTADDLKNCDYLAFRLGSSDDPLSSYIRNRLSPETAGLLESARAAAAGAEDRLSPPTSPQRPLSPPSLRDVLARDLNRLLEDANLYSPKRFAGVTLAADLVAWAKRKPQGEELQRLNRTLLHVAYPQAIPETPSVQAPASPPWKLMAVGTPVTILLLVFGLYYFKRMEQMFADIV